MAEAAVPPAARFITSGSATLDHALGGGFRAGSLVLLASEAGAGGTELALGQARALVSTGAPTPAFASVIRSPRRAAAEAQALLQDSFCGRIRFLDLGDDPLATLRTTGAELAPGTVLIVESAAALSRRAGGEDAFLELLDLLAESAAASSAAIVLLHSPGALPGGQEVRLEEVADVVLRLQWRDGGTYRRRTLRIVKVRGLAPSLEGEEARVFEIALYPGTGVVLSHIKNVA